MMDRLEVEELVHAILDERGNGHQSDPDSNKPDMMIAIRPFKAVGSEDEPIEVVGVGYFNDMLQFLCVVEEGGEIWPAFREQVFRKDAA
jgi:hypothetical protein